MRIMAAQNRWRLEARGSQLSIGLLSSASDRSHGKLSGGRLEIFAGEVGTPVSAQQETNKLPSC